MEDRIRGNEHPTMMDEGMGIWQDGSSGHLPEEEWNDNLNNFSYIFIRRLIKNKK